MKRVSFPDSDCSRFMFHKQRGIVVLIAFVLVGLLACERTPDRAPEAKKAVADKPGMVHLTAEELARTVIEVTPVARGALLVPRQYTATVQANENELAEVTTLIGGRVVTVLEGVSVGELVVTKGSFVIKSEKAFVRRARLRIHEPAPIIWRSTDEG